MLNALIATCLRHRLFVLAGVCLLSLCGVWSLTKLNVDAFPDTTPVQVQINTVAPSLVPEEVERLITFPVELTLTGLPKLAQLRSISQFGLSQVVVTFEDGVDIYFARQLINERLTTVEMPPGIPRPEMGPVSTGLGEVFHYLVMPSGPAAPSLTELRTLQDWTIRPALRTVPGTAEINSWGGLNKQYHVLFNPDLLLKHDLTFQQVVEAIRSNNLNVGGGQMNRGGEMLLVHGVGRTTNVEQLREIVITARNGVPIHLRDIAEVTIGHEIRRGAISANGQGEVVLGLGFMRMGENSYAVTHRIADRFKQATSALPPGVAAVPVYNRTELVDQVIATVRRNLCEGALLVVAILFIFLGNLRAGLIVASAIPLSMLCAFIGMSYWGIAASLLSLGALDFGLVVDGSVVMIENVIRRLSRNKDSKVSRVELIRQACSEVSKPSMFGVFIIMVVYLPILTLEGVEGKLFRPMALTVIFALAGSLVLSMTAIPVLASFLLPRNMSNRDPLLVRLLGRLYAPLLRLAMARPLIVLGTTVIALTSAASLATGLGTEFVPRLSEGSLVIGIVRPPGTSLEQSIDINTRMEKLLLEKFPHEISHIWSRQGSPEVATDPGTIESTDLFIALKPRSEWTRARSQEELVGLMQPEVARFPGQLCWFSQPIEMRINEMLSGSRADVAVKLFGPDLDTLVSKAREIETVLRAVPGCADLNTEQIKGQPVLRVKIDRNEIARHGISAESVLDVIESNGGKVVGEVVEDQLRFPLIVRLTPEARKSPDTLGGITVATGTGELIPLSRVAQIEEVRGARCVSREWATRRVLIQCNVRGRDLGGFVHEAREKLASLTLPPGGYRVEWGGQFENLQRASRRLQIVVPMAMILIIVLLYMTFHNLFDSLLVFTSVPFACIGGIIMLIARDMPFSISAAVGFIALSGISVLNSLVLVEFIRHLRDEGMPLREAIIEAGLTRLRPVLMTALVASLGFVPMALSDGMGAEVQRPLASVVIGGVISSTIMTLLVLPVLYWQCAVLTGRHRRPAGPNLHHDHADAPTSEPATALAV
jgi:heavy metal efflux system protein